MHSDITVVIATSVLPSHPSTAIIDETIASIRHHLPVSEIILQMDGIRDEQVDRTDDYIEYKKQVYWKALHEWHNVLPIEFDKHSHQSTMMAETFQYIKTPLMLYVEGDTPLTTAKSIDWDACKKMIYDGDANTIRFHHEDVIPKDHQHLMLETQGDFIRTYQWSQRPHLSSVMYYKESVIPQVPSNQFIEDTYHGVLHNAWNDYGMIGWHKHRLWIYYPDKGVHIKRSENLDGRAGGLKYTSDDEVGL